MIAAMRELRGTLKRQLNESHWLHAEIVIEENNIPCNVWIHVATDYGRTNKTVYTLKKTDNGAYVRSSTVYPLNASS